MKETFLSKWSSWWSLTRDAKQLNEAFAKELDAVIAHELALRQPPVIGSCRFYEQDNTTAMNCKHCGKSKWMHGSGNLL